MARWIERFAELDFGIEHRQGNNTLTAMHFLATQLACRLCL